MDHGLALLAIVALVLWIAGVSHMSAALDRLTAAVDAAVAKLAEPAPNDDEALAALAEKLEAATNPPATAEGNG